MPLPRTAPWTAAWLAATVCALILSTCTAEGPCTGSMRLVNPIPDVTVAVGDTVHIDLANPPVFVSTGGRISYLPTLQSGYLNVEVNRVVNPGDDGKLSILRIIGIVVGEAKVELHATSGCLENRIVMNISVTEI